MSPVAAHLATGVPLDALGPEAEGLVRLEVPRARRSMDLLVGEVLYADVFGNLITSILGEDLPPGVELRISDATVPLVRTYAEVPAGELLALVGSTGRLEISVRDGNAAEVLEVGAGEAVLAAGIAP
jgi:S-adenosylmethionine hydrolase